MMTFLFNDDSTLAAAHNEKLRAFEELTFEHVDALYRGAGRMTRNRLDIDYRDMCADQIHAAFQRNSWENAPMDILLDN